MDDLSLVKKCLQGDPDSYRFIVERYKDKVARLVFIVTNEKSGVEDLTQEVFIKLYNSLGSFKFDSSFHTWLYRIAVNHAIDYTRKKKLKGILSLNGLEEWVLEKLRGSRHDRSRIPEELQRTEEKEMVNRALQQLPKDYRKVLMLREFEGMSYKEIAVVLDISHKAVKSRLFRAREEMRKLLTPLLRGEQ